ncbi:MAG: hypothetical protein OEV66_05480 [Spirochaetia bacterium]|nr:hypothetical protein [Spirochaetia bacterium]
MYVRFLFWQISVLFLTTIVSCASPQIKDDKSLAKNHEAALKGDHESLKNYDKALGTPEDEKNPDLHEKIINDLAAIPDPQAEDILKKYAQDASPEIRGKSISAFYERRKLTDKPEIPEKLDKETLEIIANNRENYGSLTPQEIQILASMKSDEASNILIDELSKSDQQYPDEIINALGNQLSRKRKEVREFQSSNNADSGKNSAAENQANKIEASLMNFFQGDHPVEFKKHALREIYFSAGAESDLKLVELYNLPEISKENKILILTLLSASSGPEKARLLDIFKKSYLSASSRDDKSIIYSFMEVLVPDKAAQIRDTLEKSITSQETRHELKLIARKNQIGLLKTLLKKYNISPSVIDSMQNKTRDAAADKTIPMKAESVIIITCVQEIFPTKNYFEIKKLAVQGLSIPGLFYLILKTIDANYESADMKLLWIQSVWKLTHIDASRIFNAYTNEKEFLKYTL